jgi:hypothetical protein
MLLTLSYSPGQTATVFLETLDGYGQRADGYPAPVITRLVFPDLTLAAGYPVNMVQLDVGLYYYQFVLPSGAFSIGSYLVDISYTNPATGYTSNTELYQIMVSAAYGNFGLTPTHLGGPHYFPPDCEEHHDHHEERHDHHEEHHDFHPHHRKPYWSGK